MAEPQRNKQTAKCKYCEESIPKGEGIKHGNRYYHPDCLEEWRGQSDDRSQLISYILELYGLKRPTGMMLMQIKRFHEELDYTYKGMELTLRYFHETLGNPVQEDSGIGIIPYVYEDATKQYIQQMKIKESAQNEDNHRKNERVVYISPKVTERAMRAKNMIDMNDLL